MQVYFLFGIGGLLFWAIVYVQPAFARECIHRNMGHLFIFYLQQLHNGEDSIARCSNIIYSLKHATVITESGMHAIQTERCAVRDSLNIRNR